MEDKLESPFMARAKAQTIHTGHLHIQNGKIEGIPSVKSCAKSFQGLWAIICGFRTHAPNSSVMLQQHLAGSVIIDQTNMEPL